MAAPRIHVVSENIYDDWTTSLPTSDPQYHVGSGRLVQQNFYDPAFSTTVAKEAWKYSYDAFGRKLSVERFGRETVTSALVSLTFTEPP
ncbi:MAG: hypothetical protein U0892_02890 [Pirellulales bacterium]